MLAVFVEAGGIVIGDGGWAYMLPIALALFALGLFAERVGIPRVIYKAAAFWGMPGGRAPRIERQRNRPFRARPRDAKDGG